MMGTASIENKNCLVDCLQKCLNNSCTILKGYNDSVRSNLEQIEEKMAEEKVKKLSSINVCVHTQLHTFKSALQLIFYFI